VQQSLSSCVIDGMVTNMPPGGLTIDGSGQSITVDAVALRLDGAG